MSKTTHSFTSLVSREKKDFYYLGESLSELKRSCGVIGIKQSFEDEAAMLDDVISMRRITELNDALLYVKIGGCEALTDINNCVLMGVNAIIAPMIETEYAFSKFMKSVGPIEDIESYFLCETKTCYDNIDKILSLPQINKISGVILGRSDFAKSYGLNKSEVDSDFISEKVEKVFRESKSLGLSTTMGGNISLKSSKFIKKMFEENLLDKIETRNVVVKLDNKNVSDIDYLIKQVLLFEMNWLKYKSKHYNGIRDSYMKRINELKERI
jgi:hypothetical protein